MIKEIKLDNPFMSLVYVDNMGDMFELTHIVTGEDVGTDTGLFKICQFNGGYLGNINYQSAPSRLINDLYVKVDKEYIPVVKIIDSFGHKIIDNSCNDTLSLIATLGVDNRSFYFMVRD